MQCSGEVQYQCEINELLEELWDKDAAFFSKFVAVLLFYSDINRHCTWLQSALIWTQTLCPHITYILHFVKFKRPPVKDMKQLWIMDFWTEQYVRMYSITVENSRTVCTRFMAKVEKHKRSPLLHFLSPSTVNDFIIHHCSVDARLKVPYKTWWRKRPMESWSLLRDKPQGTAFCTPTKATYLLVHWNETVFWHRCRTSGYTLSLLRMSRRCSLKVTST